MKQKVGFVEKLIYAVGGLGSNLSWGFISAYITIYITDNLMLSSIVMGTVIMIARIFDGISDIIVGYLIDRTRSKMGKARAWVLWSAVPLGILTYFCFNVPEGLSQIGKYIFISVAYFLVSVIVFTANNVAYSSLPSFMTEDKKERITLGVMSYIFIMAASLLCGFVPSLKGIFGDTGTGYHNTSIVFSILITVVLLMTALVVKERNVAESINPQDENFLHIAKILITDKQFLLIVGVFMGVAMKNTASVSGIYYMTYVLGNAQYNGLMSMSMVIPFIIGILFASPIINKVGIKKSVVSSFALALTGYAIMGIFSTNLKGMMFGMAVCSLGYVPAAASQTAIIASVADYIYWRYGSPAQGTTFSCTSAVNKLGSGLASALTGLLLGISGYVANSTTQPASALLALRALYIYIPMFFCVCSLILFLFFNLEKLLPIIQKDIAAGNVGEKRTKKEIES